MASSIDIVMRILFPKNLIHPVLLGSLPAGSWGEVDAGRRSWF